MKKCGIVFLGLLLLSALFITIGGAAISSAGSDAFVLSRERVYGEAAAMEGISLRAENTLAGGHLELEAGTDIKTQSRWRMSLTDAAYVSVSSLLMPGGDLKIAQLCQFHRGVLLPFIHNTGLMLT